MLPFRASPPWSWADAAIMAVFALGVGSGVWHLQKTLAPAFLTAPAGNDVWFEADLPTVADTVLHRWSVQQRNARHPLMPLVMTTSAYALRQAGLDDRSILAALAAAGSAIWILLFFVIARAVTNRRLDAAIFTSFACSTAGALFWMSVPETYIIGSVSLLLPLAVYALDTGRNLDAWWYTAASAASLGITTTNWMAGIVAAAARWPVRRVVQITMNALAIVVVLWCVQRTIYPTAPFFFGYSDEKRFMLTAASGGPGPVLRTLFFHSIVMPAIQIIPEPKWGWAMSVQHAGLGSSGLVGIAATMLWGMLLAVAVVAWASSRTTPWRFVLPSTILGQAILHVIYGEETFLYVAHITPLLILGVATASATRLRAPVLVLTVALTAAAAINNAGQLSVARSYFARQAPKCDDCTAAARTHAGVAKDRGSRPPTISRQS